MSVRTLIRAAVLLSAALSVALSAGCQMPSAQLQLLDGLDTALGSVADGQQHVREAVLSQLVGQREALDAAFEADLRGLAAGHGGGGDEQAEPTVRLDDVLAAKRLYDARRTELDASRQGVGETFDRLAGNLDAGRRMVDMLRRLTLQQHVLLGQTELVVDLLLKRSQAGSAGLP